MNKVEFARMLARIGGDKPHILYSRAYEIWFCLGRHCIGQGTHEAEAFFHWRGISDANEAGKRHTVDMHAQEMPRALPLLPRCTDNRRSAENPLGRPCIRSQGHDGECMSAVLDTAEELNQPPLPCAVPLGPPCYMAPLGWRCTRMEGHDGPCAAVPTRMQLEEPS